MYVCVIVSSVMRHISIHENLLISEIHVPFCNSYTSLFCTYRITNSSFIVFLCAWRLGQCFNSFYHFCLKQTCKHNSFYSIFFLSLSCFFLLLYYNHFSFVAMLFTHFSCIWVNIQALLRSLRVCFLYIYSKFWKLKDIHLCHTILNLRSCCI